MDSAHGQPRAPGRLGDPSMYLATDPRTHPSLVEKLRADKIEGSPTFVAALSPDALLGEVAAFTRTVEDYLEEYYTNMDLSPMPGEGSHGPIIRTEETIPSSHSDASSSCTPRTMRLIIHRPDPATTPGPLHTIIYLHGGAMVMLSATNPLHTAWARSLAATGLMVISPDFRNVLAPNGDLHPFPAGLDDCVAAVRWVAAHRKELGIGQNSKLILQGESGGANLALATALRAHREGWLPGAVVEITHGYPWVLGTQTKWVPMGGPCQARVPMGNRKV